MAVRPALFQFSPNRKTRIMTKRFMLAVATASLMFLGAPASGWAEPEHAGRHEFSSEDRAALTDAHIAALKAGLKLTPAQEKNWPAFEAALRDAAKARAARIAEWHEKAKDEHDRLDLIEKLHGKAKALTAHAVEMDKIADAAKPLYDGLDDAQKRRFGMLFHAMMRMHGHMERMGHMGHMGAGQEDSEHAD